MKNETTKHAHITRDRVSISVSHKFGLPNYSSFGVDVGLSSDRQGEETIDKTTKRVEGYVIKEYERMSAIFHGKKVIK